MRASNMLLAALALAPLVAVTANAAVVTDTVTFSATDFTSNYGQAAPENPVTGSFNITFDTTTDYTNETSGITLNSLNITLDSAISFNYSTTTGQLQVGGVANGAQVIDIDPSSNDFYLDINDFATDPAFRAPRTIGQIVRRGKRNVALSVVDPS